MALLDGVTVTVETALTPPMVVDVNAEPGLVSQLLKPKVTISKGASVLYVSAPQGEPAPARSKTVLFVFCGLALILLLVGLLS